MDGECTPADAHAHAAALETLPVVVLDQLCEFLDVSTLNGLAAFSLTSTRCAAAAKRVRLRFIHLRLSTESKLSQDLDDLHHFISNGHYTYIRQLKLTGNLLGPEENKDLARPQNNRYFGIARNRLGFPLNLQDYPVYDFCSRPPSIQEKQQIADAWRPLARFIALLNLSDLVYECPQELPPCILETLHVQSPGTRLHIHTFALRSIQAATEISQAISPDELSLVTSPCLYSIAANYQSLDRLSRDRQMFWRNYNYGVLSAMLTGLSPNLTNLSILESHHMNWDLNPLLSQDPFQAPSQTPISSKAHLQTLVCEKSMFLRWLDCINPNQLNTLRVQGFVSLEQLQVLVHTALSVGFVNLRSLALKFPCASRLQQDAMEFQVGQLLRALPPLNHLSIIGNIGEVTYKALLDHHGSALETLEIEPGPTPNLQQLFFSLDHIKQLAVAAPQLVRFRVACLRTGRDQDEVDLYRALGQLRRLRNLTLRLRCGAVERRRPEGDENRTRLPASIFREALIRCAIDSKFAQEVFSLIQRGSGALKCLTLRSGRAYDIGRGWGDSDAIDVLGFINQSWVCERDEEGEMLVKQLHSEWPSSGSVLQRDFANRHDLKAVWTEMWPGSGPDRREDWHSLPLASNENIIHE